MTDKSVELCVDCPLVKSYIPVTNACLEYVGRTDSKVNALGQSNVALHGDSEGVFHEVRHKCEHLGKVNMDRATGDLIGIVCNYQKQ